METKKRKSFTLSKEALKKLKNLEAFYLERPSEILERAIDCLWELKVKPKE